MEKAKRKPHDEPRRSPVMKVFAFIWNLISGTAKGIGWLIQHGAIGSWWTIKKVSNGVWWAITQSAGGAWWTVKQGVKGTWWLIQQPYYIMRYLLNGRIPEFESKREEEIFWRIKRHWRRKKLLLVHALAYGGAFFMGSFYISDTYFRWQRAIAEAHLFLSSYRNNFYDAITTVAFVMGIWTLIIAGHYIFNKMGNAEDEALGDALDQEYERANRPQRSKNSRDAVSVPSVARLIDEPNEDTDYYEDEKPKRNGAYS